MRSMKRGVMAAGIAMLGGILNPAIADREQETGVRALATIGMVGDVVHAVGGDHAVVDVLMGPGVDPHLFKATRSDMASMLGADIVFYNGLLLEGKLSDSLIRVAGKKPVVAVTESISEGELLHPEDMDGLSDPHVWMDPRRWAATVDVIRDSMIELSPDHAEAFGANARAYRARLDSLDGYCERVLASVPPEQRVLVTAHDAFNYLADRYGFTVLGVQGVSTESEAGVRDIENIVDFVCDRKIGAVFVESTVSDRNVRAIIDGAAARGHTVKLGGELYSDAMGKPGTYEGTYIGMIDHNVTTIARALGGEAPAGGMSGKLSHVD